MSNVVVPKSTLWARANKEKVKQRDSVRKRTLDGKLTNLITTSRYRSKIKNIEHTIDTEFLKELYQKQEGNCALSGIKMEIRGTKWAANSPYSISLDRIDSNKGYTEDNVWLVCTGVNLMKSRLTMEQFVTFCKEVAEKFI